MSYLDPVIASALVSMAPAHSICHRLAAYHDILSMLDWQYQFADDHAVFKRGEQMVARAHLLQAEVDPSGDLWRSYSGSRMHGAPQPKVVEVAA